MPDSFTQLIQSWDGLGVVTRFDQPTGSWIFICLHDNTLGPPTGGTRMKVYPQPADGLLDAMRLATGMTAKWAAIGIDFGGGKAVIAVPHALVGEERNGLLRRYGHLVESLRGAFRTGEDLGTTTEDLLVVSESTSYVHGFDPESGEKIDPSPFTAHGVYCGLRSALEQVFGSDDPSGRRILIEGVGNVGGHLARRLAEDGAAVLLADLDWDRARSLAEELHAETTAPTEVATTPCDVYAPCAVGATLNRTTIPQLACRIVAGSANNQLAEEVDAERLQGRDILYAPDYVINGGGALAFGLLDSGLADRQEMFKRVASIGTHLSEIFTDASRRQETPLAAAQRRVRQRLAESSA